MREAFARKEVRGNQEELRTIERQGAGYGVEGETDILFQRLGFHLPPALEEGKVAAFISDLVKKEPNEA